MVAEHSFDSLQRARYYVGLVVVPLQYTVHLPFDLANKLIADFSSQKSLARENANLRADLLLLKSNLQKQYALEYENQQLKELLQSSDKISGRVLKAQLLAVATNQFSQQIIIDKGNKDGVFVGQPVLDAYGIMGQIVETGMFASRVMLITDSRSAIPVQIQRNGIRAIAAGDSRHNSLRLRYIADTEDIKEGDILITSGLDRIYPFGYPVGTIEKISHSPNEQFADIIIKPAAHLNRSSLVLLVTVDKTRIEPAMESSLNQSNTLVTNAN